MTTSFQHTDELCRTLFEEASDSIFISDVKGRFLEVNPQGCVLLGYDREELGQLAWSDLLLSEDRTRALLAWEEGNENQPAWIEDQLRDKEGRWFTVEIRLRRLAEGQLIAFVRDISLYKQAVEIQIGYELLVGQSRDIILLIRYGDGRILEANLAATKAYGYSREELLALSIHDLHAPETQAQISAQMDQASAQGLLFETIHRHKDGSTFPVEVSSQGTIIRGRPTLISVIRDITERKRAEAALRRSEHKFATAFRTSPDAININRLSDGLYLDINEGFTRITGYTREEVLGQSSLALNIWANPAERARLVQNLRDRGEVENLETEFWLKDGSLRTGLMSARLIEIEGEVCILSITRDITERKRMEVALLTSETNYRLLSEFNRQLNDISISFNEAASVDELWRTIGETYRRLTGAIGAIVFSTSSRQELSG
ncbi:MAG: PAS domain S-box protein [Anaerolineales bacterium]|nr:PAS domain S-box protein [Anaerolineales bacterium]